MYISASYFGLQLFSLSHKHHRLRHVLQNHLNWFTLICMVLSLLPPVKDTATGSPSLMMATSYQAAMRLKRKSQALEAFKLFKATAENQHDAKIKELQDNKGGEYMSNEFIQFTDSCGIHRRHTACNRPQQNGVAERANRTMGDDISAMLYEVQLPPLLWGEALATQIHVWNRLPTSSLKGMTLYKAWFKRKPDVSHLRVWGCLAYVFIQKDKQHSLQPHITPNTVSLKVSQQNQSAY